VKHELKTAPEIEDFALGHVRIRHFPPGPVVVPISGALLLLVRAADENKTVAPPRNTRVSSTQLSASSSPPRQADSDDKLVKKKKLYQILNQVGKGAFGTVHLAQDERGHKVAVKRIPVDREFHTREVELLQMIKHPCVVPFLDTYEGFDKDSKERHVYLVMDYLPTNLHLLIGGKPVAIDEFRCFAFQLLRSLLHLHSLGICHRDVKPENVLLRDRALQLADFGSAKIVASEGSSNSYICSRWWRAPELVLGTADYSTAVDWWSCGCVIAEMMYGEPVFKGQSSCGQILEITRVLGTPGFEDVRALKPGGGKNVAKHLMMLAELQREAIPWKKFLPTYANHPDALELPAQLLVYDPTERLHPGEALCHRVFANLSEDTKLPTTIFDFTAEELSCSRAREALLDMASRRPASTLPTPSVARSCLAAGAQITISAGSRRTREVSGALTDESTPKRCRYM